MTLKLLLALPFFINLASALVVSLVAFYTWLFTGESYWLLNLNGERLAGWFFAIDIMALPAIWYLVDKISKHFKP